MLLALLALTTMAPIQPSVDFENYIYDVTPCNPGRITMRRGEGEQDVEGATLHAYVEQVVIGELAAGKTYAVVRLSCSFPVGGSSAAYLYSIRFKKARYLETLATADTGEGHVPAGWIHVRFARSRLYVDHSLLAENWDIGIATIYGLRNNKVVPLSMRRHKYTF